MNVRKKVYNKIVAKTAKFIHSKQGNDLIKIRFPYRRETVDFVKTIPERKYYFKKKLWTCPVTKQNIKRLKDNGFILCEKLNALYEPTNNIKPVEIPEFKGELYPYQKQGVAFIEMHDGRALIADEMGLGKTIQAIAYLLKHPELRPAVIICPANVKYNWRNEFIKFTNIKNINICNGKTPQSKIEIDQILKNPNFPLGEILIINYDILANKFVKETNADGKIVEKEIKNTGWADFLKKLNIKALVMDEIHYIKNNKSKRTKALKSFAKNIPCRIGLSGTPIENKPIDIYESVNIINRNIFPNFLTFVKRYCNAKHNGFGWDYSGHSNTKELHSILTENIMIRRLKKDHLKELPDKQYSILQMDIDNEKEYKEAEIKFKKFVQNNVLIKTRQQFAKSFELQNYTDHRLNRLKNENKKVTFLSIVEELKQLTLKGKFKSVFSWIDDFLQTEQKLVIFVHHKFVVKELMKRYSNIAVKLDGSTTNKQKPVDIFQNNPDIKLFIGSESAGVGINLTSAFNIMLLEFPWTPGKLAQWIDRCHRKGQKNAVNVYYAPAIETIEEKMVNILNSKMKILNSALDGANIHESSILDELIEEYL